VKGVWIFVCGPSGAGKDSVMAWAQQALSANQNIVFARRLVTRPGHTGPAHDSVDKSDLLDMAKTGALRWHWQAHGFHYGIEARYAAEVDAGKLVVVNGSRAHVVAMTPAAALKVVHITTIPENLKARLTQRGRDTPESVTERLMRNADFISLDANFTIDNDAEVQNAGQRLVDYLLSEERAATAAAIFRTPL
jgi:ribose 1,5-bisphosphokinase